MILEQLSILFSDLKRQALPSLVPILQITSRIPSCHPGIESIILNHTQDVGEDKKCDL